VGTAFAFTPGKLVIGVLSPAPQGLGDLPAALEARFGPVDLAAGPVDFTWSTYYDREMGTGLRRWFISFSRLVDPADLASVKETTNRLEAGRAADGRRTVNLDPGLLTLPRFTLATTKESAHRVPLARGIYVEITLAWHDGEWTPLEWTYPDYRSPWYRETLARVRALYKAQLRDTPNSSMAS
jgi:hypothetical protein